MQSSGWKFMIPVATRHHWMTGLVLLLLGVLGMSSGVYAGSFNIKPVRINLSDKLSTEILQVTNSGNADVTIQLQAMRWSQQDGEDQLTVTRDLIATPQIFNLKAGASQIIRVGLIKKLQLATEATYRLILEEIPPPPEPGFQGLKLALRLSLPVFVKPDGNLHQSFDIRLAHENAAVSDAITLDLNNTGRSHVQLLGMKIHSADDQEALLGSLDKSLYLLAGQKKQLVIKRKSDLRLPEAILIRAETSTGKVEFHAKPGAP